MNELTVKNIICGYQKKTVLNDICFSVPGKTIVGILGCNGCGKTTLLKAIAGLLPHKGECQFNDQILELLTARERALCCGYIPQQNSISIDLSVMEVVLMGFNPDLKLLQSPTKQMKQKAADALELVGLDGRIHDHFMNLSAGQKQLVLLARTFACDRRLFLLDEPESALDFRLRYQAIGLLRQKIQKNQGIALITLHDSSLALNYCGLLLVLSEKKLIGEIRPFHTPIPKTEQLLSEIYGTISIKELTTHNGQKRLVMLKEDDIFEGSHKDHFF